MARQDGGFRGVSIITELDDVTITTPVADNELLAFDDGSSEWINQTAKGAGLASLPIDISDDTNLAADSPIILTDDTLSLGTIDIDDDTNLAATSPIVLISDTLSFNFTTTNTWSGDNTFSGEVKGTKESIMMGYNRSLACAAGVEKFLQIGDTIKMTDDKGICMIRDGSIVGMSINFDITGATGKIANLLLRVKKNGTAVWEEAMSNTIQSTDKTDYKTQARGTDTFSAGDTISVCVEADGASGTLTIAKVLVQLEYYYDD